MPQDIDYLNLKFLLFPRLPEDGTERKSIPMGTGLLDYFPDALAAVAHVSYVGNEQHNPGQPLHWARGKSTDHADCIIRHYVDRGTLDKKGVRHSAMMAWRALAFLQEEIEKEKALPLPRGARLEEAAKVRRPIPRWMEDSIPGGWR